MAALTELFGFPFSGSISPSVRLLEKDFSAYQPGTSLSKSALIGFASKGPINEPTQVFNHEDLYRNFGYPDPTVDHGSYLLYAAIEFLRYGSEAWIVRVGVTDESDWDNFAKTAYVEVPASGLSAVIRTQLSGSTSVTIEEDINDKFRFSTNDSLYKRTVQIPAGDYTLTDQGSGNNLVDAFNALFVANDGIEAFVSNDTLAFRTTDRYGSNASIELISVEDSIYSTIEIGEEMDYAILAGENTVWPLGSSAIGYDFSGLTEPTLRVRVNGTGDSSIDNVTQTIPFDDLTQAYVSPDYDNPVAGQSDNDSGYGGPVASAAQVAGFINWWIDNPTKHTQTIPGGFRARVGTGNTVELYTAKRYIDGGVASTADGLTTINSNTTGYGELDDDGLNYIKGSDALVQVQFYSQNVDEILGFDGNAATGSILTAESTTSFINGGSTTIDSGTYYIDDIGKVTGSAYSASTAPTLMTIWADSPGITGNNTQVEISIDSEDGTISLSVYNNSNFVESHGNLNLDSTTTNNPYYIETWVNELSDYIYIEHETDVTGAPLVASYSLGTSSSTQGSDGYPYTTAGIPDTSAIDALITGNSQTGTGLYSLAEPEKIDIDLVAAPGLNSSSVMGSLIELCEITRRDCMAILDTPFGLESSDVKKWHNGAHPLNSTKLDTSYAALYWPWVKIRDSFNAIDVWIPPTGDILGVYANSERSDTVWAAPAGLKRGLVPTVKEVETYAYLTERDSLYGNRNAVNVIVPLPVEGPTVWGQKTLQRNPTALDRVNVRRLMLYIEKSLKQRSRVLLFEPHDEILRSTFVKIASTFLDEIKTGRGIYAYTVKCDEELNPASVIDRNEMRARIGIQPTKTAEFIFIEFTVYKTGSFEESDI